MLLYRNNLFRIALSIICLCMLSFSCGKDKAVVDEDLPVIVNNVRLRVLPYRVFCQLEITNNSDGRIRVNVSMELKNGDDVLKSWQEPRYISEGYDELAFYIDDDQTLNKMNEQSMCHLKRIEGYSP